MKRPRFRFMIGVGLAFVIVILVSSMIVARQIGHDDLPSVGAQAIDSGACNQPCWRNIQLGKTSFRQAENLLRADPAITFGSKLSNASSDLFRWQGDDSPLGMGMVSPHNAGDPDSPVESIRLFTSIHAPTVLLGDAIRRFGEPIEYELCWRTDTMDGHVYFANHVEVTISPMYTAMGNRMQAYDPNLKLSEITYYATGEHPFRREPRPWQGFITPPLLDWKCHE